MTNDKIPPMQVEIIRLDHATDLELPAYQSSGASGLDLQAALELDETITIAPGAREFIPTGMALAIPRGFEVQVRPRSGLAAKHGVTVLNSPGTIDSDYRGEIKVILINHGQNPFNVKKGDRIAQMVVQKITRVELVEVPKLTETSRGDGGFGSTGS